MKKTLIALAIASIAAAATAYAETIEMPPVTVTGKSAPDAVDGYASGGNTSPEGGGGSAGGGAGGGDASAPPQPPPPPPPPPKTKTQCVADCAVDRLVRDNQCQSDADALRRSLAAQAEAAQRAKLGWMILKNLGVDIDLSELVLANIDRQIADYKSFCGGIAAEAQNACLNNCKTLVGLLLGALGWVREA